MGDGMLDFSHRVKDRPRRHCVVHVGGLDRPTAMALSSTVCFRDSTLHCHFWGERGHCMMVKSV